MEIKIDFTKSLEENASNYFNESKKAKQKRIKVEKAIIETEKKIEKLKSKKTSEEKKHESKAVKKRKTEWFEKFHWFFTSENFLVISGRDAKSNEIVIKKHMEEKDIYFHADIQGAAHTVLKTNGKIPGKKSLEEAARFAAVYSKTWNEKLSSIDVYSAKPSQVTKKAKSGESLGTGAFMVYGERQWYKNTPIDFALGLEEISGGQRIISGPLTAIKQHSKIYIVVEQGKESAGRLAKQVVSLFIEKTGNKLNISLDEIIKMMPPQGIKLAKSNGNK